MWLIHIFVKKTAREIRNERSIQKHDGRTQYFTQFKNNEATYNQASARSNENNQKISDFSEIDLKSREEKLEIEALKRHLIKHDSQLKAPAQAAANKDNSLHKVATVTKKDKEATWIKKDNSSSKENEIIDPAKNFAVIADLQKREVIAAEFLRFFIPETPKYRIIDGNTQVISKKVGLNRADGNYADDIKTFKEHGNSGIDNIKQKL